jgi:hypothetical protein
VFTENSLELESVQWVEDGSFEVGGDPSDRRPTFLFTRSGQYTVDGVHFGALAGAWAGPGENGKIDASAGSELLLVRFPEPSSEITLGLTR